MNNYLASFGPAFANHLWQSTAFAAAAWLLTILLRRNSARVRYGVWLAASVKFLIPFSLLIALGGLLPKPTQPVAPAVYAAMKATEQPFADISVGPITSAVQTLTLTQRIAADIPAILVALWLVGTLTVLIIWFQRWRKASFCLHEAVPAGHGRELEILRRLEARVGNGRHSPLRLRLSAEPSEPSIFGIFRSVFVWPERLSERLEDEHIEAIMAHELAHARRFDNATAALHMLVEALFWFHPLVWWMERRMIEERECACDETVIALGARPDAYAEGVLRTCRFCIESPLPCVAGVTGADLKKRVVDIVTAHTLMRMTLPKKLLLGAASLCVVTAPVLLGQMNTLNDWEKAAGGKMSFEVASVKEDSGPKTEISNGALHPPVRPSSNFPLNNSDAYSPNGGLFSATNWPLPIYIGFAYKLDPGQIMSLLSQLPKWANEERFDIEARAAGNASKDQMRLMMQSLLANRFQLAMHVQREQGPVYALILNNPGKIRAQLIRRSQAARCDSAAPVAVPSSVPQPLADDIKDLSVPCGTNEGLFPRNMPGMFCWVGRDDTLDRISGLFSSPLTDLNRPVLNRTGLTGRFDFILYWAQEPPTPLPPESEANPPAGPTFVGALKDQLGLKLESTTGSVEKIVVDHVEEPTPN